MADEGISPQVRAFIADYVESAVQLEVLLLLAGRRDRGWSAADVAQELRIETGWVDEQFHVMSAKGLLGSDPADPSRCRFAPKSPDLDRAVTELAKAYADRRVTVIGLIFSKPLDKIRDFADAFRFRKDDSDDR